MGFLDDLALLGRHVPTDAKNKLAEILREMPITKIVHGQAQFSPNRMAEILRGMPVFDANDQTGVQEGMNWAQPMGMLGKIVYHGSPHKFDKFDASKIGTGEGAQAYGHGQYLADAELVAKDYAKRLGNQAWGVGGDDSSGWFAEWAAPSRKQALDSRQYFKTKKDAMDFAKSKETGEYLYKADLPDEWIPKMLDWDKPLSEQPEAVKNSIKKMYEHFPDTFTGANVVEGMPQRSSIELSMWQKMLDDATANDPRPEKIRYIKENIYRLSNGKAFAAEELKRVGIPGIKYLDGGSRGKGQGSYNYVVFPGLEDQVKILERNGVPINRLAEIVK